VGNQARLAGAVLTAGLLAIAAADGSLAASSVIVRVEATANPWAAGQAGPLGESTLPAEIALPEAATTVWFPHVHGTWSNTGPMLSPDGEPPVVDPPFACGQPPPCAVVASNGLSGLTDAARFWYLTGVFLGSAAPGGTPPPSIDFTRRHEFRVLKPELAQPFFVGDGRASDGIVQQFRVPPGATRLFLGMADICAPGQPAGCYYDNNGSLEVTMSWGSMPDTTTLPARAAAVHDSNWWLLAAVGAVALLTALHRRPRPIRTASSVRGPSDEPKRNSDVT
jgi:hypothetical protein